MVVRDVIFWSTEGRIGIGEREEWAAHRSLFVPHLGGQPSLSNVGRLVVLIFVVSLYLAIDIGSL